MKLESGRLAEEVKDCGPVVDLEATPGCFLVKDGADPKADFPACCPVYECEEGTEVTNSLINMNTTGKLSFGIPKCQCHLLSISNDNGNEEL